VAAGDDLLGGEDAGPQEGLLEVPAHVRGAAALERQVAALGAEDDLVAGEAALAQGRPHRALAALISVVDGGVDDVDAELQRAADGIGVERVGLGVVAAEVGADAQRRDAQSAQRLAEVTFGRAACRLEPDRPLRRRLSLQHQRSIRLCKIKSTPCRRGILISTGQRPSRRLPTRLNFDECSPVPRARTATADASATFGRCDKRALRPRTAND